MSARAWCVEVRTQHTAWIISAGRDLVPLLDRLGIARQYDHDQRCWMVPRKRLPDLLADCQRHRRAVEVVEVLL